MEIILTARAVFLALIYAAFLFMLWLLLSTKEVYTGHRSPMPIKHPLKAHLSSSDLKLMTTRKFSKHEIARVFSIPADQIQWINSNFLKGKTMFKKRILKTAIKLMRPIVLAIIQSERRPGGLLHK